MIITFIYIFSCCEREQKYIMIAMILVTIPIEYLCSVHWKIYSYRLFNLPLYVPVGHSIVYITAFNISKDNLFNKYLTKRIIIFEIVIIFLAVFWLICDNDIFGFICCFVFIYILKATPRNKIFLCALFITVSYLEFTGTLMQNWEWQATLQDQAWDILPRGNPPFGVAIVYYVFDLICFSIYGGYIGFTQRQKELSGRLS